DARHLVRIVMDLPLEILTAVRGIYDKHSFAIRDAIHEKVVENSTIFTAHHRVQRAAILKRTDVVGDEVLHTFRRVRTADENLAHVANVENAGSRANTPVLVDDAGVLDRHLVPSKGGETRAESSMNFVKRGPFDSLRRVHFRPGPVVNGTKLM